MASPSSRLIFGLIPWYGALIVLGAGLAVFLADREANRLLLPEDTVIDLALLVLPLGILGARLYYVAFSWKAFSSHPISILFVWEGGLAIYGGLIAGFMTTFFFCRKRHIPFSLMLDILAPGIALAQSVGRWGNYFNQEAYGIPFSNPALCFFPMAVLISENGVPVWHAAAFFYESLLDMCIFCFLLWGRRHLFRRRGDVFGAYALLYAAGRILIENLRTDALFLTVRIRISQLLSLIVCQIAVFCLSRRVRHSEAHLCLWIFRILPFLAGLPALLFCLGWSPPLFFPMRNQLLLLGAFSFATVLSALILYDLVKPTEVVYAHHQMEK